MKALLALALAAATVPATAAAAPAPTPYGRNDAGGFRDVLPPGANGFDNAAQAGAFYSRGERPPHNDDQLAMYRDLLYASPTLSAARLGSFYKDSRFGARSADRERTYSTRADVTLVRDRFGVPH